MKLFQGEIWLKNKNIVYCFAINADSLKEAKEIALKELNKNTGRNYTKDDLRHQYWTKTSAKPGAVQMNLYRRQE